MILITTLINRKYYLNFVITSIIDPELMVLNTAKYKKTLMQSIKFASPRSVVD